MKVKMNQPVKWTEGIIKTPREMVDSGMGYIREFPNFMGKRRAVLVESRYGSVEVSEHVKASFVS